MIQVSAPLLGMAECRTHQESELVKQLHLRAETAKWFAETRWEVNGPLVICLDVIDKKFNLVIRSLRIDFNGERVLCGEDETYQYVKDLVPGRPGIALCEGLPPIALADFAADWLEQELARTIIRQERDNWRFSRQVWLFADTGKSLIFGDSANKRKRFFLGAPDTSVVIGEEEASKGAWASNK